ncbi:hypothetical protein BDF19DRAFT_444723 [Syncephalis fuscata]|nr:hypothetical protein BDF19DRAFT_444723 [Syncephalis fuscata]
MVSISSLILAATIISAASLVPTVLSSPMPAPVQLLVRRGGPYAPYHCPYSNGCYPDYPRCTNCYIGNGYRCNYPYSLDCYPSDNCYHYC